MNATAKRIVNIYNFIRAVEPRWRRAPFTSVDDEAMERLESALGRLKSAVGGLCDAAD